MRYGTPRNIEHYVATMRRYFFHLHEDDGRVEDEEGTEFPSLDAARAFAVKNARTIIAHDVSERGIVPLGHLIEIADGQGNIASVVKFGEAVALQ